jgi:hypothetical protein
MEWKGATQSNQVSANSRWLLGAVGFENRASHSALRAASQKPQTALLTGFGAFKTKTGPRCQPQTTNTNRPAHCLWPLAFGALK